MGVGILEVQQVIARLKRSTAVLLAVTVIAVHENSQRITAVRGRHCSSAVTVITMT
jgi:hypothetical protein